MKYIRLLFFLFLVSLGFFAQQPAYFKLGEEQFRGVQIYDVIQDKNLNYLFATNEGIYSYNHYTFKKLEFDKTKSRSVFKFVMNSKGIIYCHNLNNQIFKIAKDSCTLFYELNSAEGSSDISLEIGSKDELVIGARRVIVLNEGGQVIKQTNKLPGYLGPSFVAPDKSIHFHLGGQDTVLVYGKGTFTKHKTQIPSSVLKTNSVIKLFSIGPQSYAVDLNTGTTYAYNVSAFDLTALPKNALSEINATKRIYQTGNEIWVAGTLPGVSRFNDLTGNDQFMYGDHFISNVFKDYEGNVLLSTFDKGVLVIPDLKVPDVIYSFRDDPVTAFHTTITHGLIMGTSKGKFMKYLNGELTVLKESAKRSVEAIYGPADADFVLFDNGGGSYYNLRTGEIKNILGPSLKDVVVDSESKFFIGTNLGIYEVYKTKNDQFSSNVLKETNFRVYAMEYDPENSLLYASTANGFFKIDSLGHPEKILFQGEDLFPNGIYGQGGNIYLCTEKNAVLVIHKGKIIKVIETKVNGKVESLKKLVIVNNTIIANSANGLFQFSMDGQLLRSLHSVFGFKTKKVTDFKLEKDHLWVSHSGGVQQIDLNYAPPNLSNPLIRLDAITVNDTLTDPAKTNLFQSHQRKVQIVFSSPALKNRESIKYHYKLVGYDTNWVINDFELNQVTYNALDAGSYTFIVKAQNQNLYSEEIAYSFTIAPHFYATWWFILLCVVLFLIIVTMVYRWQLAAQNKKLQQQSELNASKLTAIQSQMNPHFIFNALNSIQDLVLKGDIENSYTFISKFSSLVRMTLNYSDKDFIDFEKEMELLELYLTLEKLRFKKTLDYKITVDNEADILIPPLLIQPFIENALVHGLLHKDGNRRLSIHFHIADSLICTVEDNGIGREKAKAIKLRQRSEHESFSGKAIQKRFELLSHAMNSKFGYSYEDLYENNIATGTRVVLTIPVKHKF